MGRNIISGVDMSSSVHILILCIGPTQELDDTTLTPEAKFSIYFSRSNKNLFKPAYQCEQQFFIC